MPDGMIAGPGPRRVCVIGAGLGGLALAVRLQAAGVNTVLIEAREQPGGFAAPLERAGFRFDGGPASLTDRAALAELWHAAGAELDEDLELLPITPGWRFNWPDGALFDYTPGVPDLAQAVARLAPGDLAGFDAFQQHASGLWHGLDEGPPRPRQSQWDRARRALTRQAPGLLRHHGWRTLYGLTARTITTEKLREALCFPALLQGVNPLTAPATWAALHHSWRGGLWYPKGGMGAVFAALIRRFERLGGTLRLHDPVLHVATLGNRISEVETASGWRERFDAVASNADALHTWRDLLAGPDRARDQARKLIRGSFAPSMFVVHFGIEGTWPGIPHNTVLFGPRFKGLLDDVFTHGVLPQDQLIILHHPSVTDPGAAPPGNSSFTAMIPVAHQGKLPLDWEALGALIERRVLAEVGRRLIPDLDDRIVVKFHRSPRDHALDLNAAMGSAFGPQPPRYGLPRRSPRDAKIGNLYFVGTAARTGAAGTGGALASAQTTADLMLENLK